MIAEWLPHTDISSDDAPAAALSVACDTRPNDPAQPPTREVGCVRAWNMPSAERVIMLTPTGHAQVDLRGRLARVDPGDDRVAAAALLDLTVALLLARVHAAILNASAVVDGAGWGWLLVGARRERARLASTFCEDGFGYVSEGQVLLRRGPLNRDVVVAESWHRPPAHSSARSSGAAPPLPWDRWQPLAPVKGILLASATDPDPAGGRNPAGWAVAARSELEGAFGAAVSYAGVDGVGDTNVAALIGACLPKAAYRVPVDPRAQAADPRPAARLRALVQGQPA
ncbi:MAG: hypothetical protein U9Q74_16635 [Gemmatimonadota bacterium]|nr:hypothetical protein [Gemmatimonadota bacterium]